MSESLKLIQKIYLEADSANSLDNAIKLCESHLNALADLLGVDMNSKELLVFSLLVEMSIEDSKVDVLNGFARHLCVNKSSILEVLHICDHLEKLNLIHKSNNRIEDFQKLSDINYYISYQMIASLSNNVLYKSNKTLPLALNNIDFINRAKKLFKDRDYENIRQDELYAKLIELFNANQHLHIVNSINQLYIDEGFSIEDVSEFSSGLSTTSKFFVIPVFQYAFIMKLVLNASEGVFKYTIPGILNYLNTDTSQIVYDEDYLNSKEHPLALLNLINNLGTGASKSDICYFEFGNKFLNYFLGNDSKGLLNLSNNSMLIMPEDIKSKELYFNDDLDLQLSQVLKLLNKDTYDIISDNLINKFNSNPGVCILFEGAAGSGKTEYALQLAKVTGRPIYKVDISQQKSAYVGESEKLIKELFDNYKSFCTFLEVKPILLLNEADAIFSKRIAIRYSVDQTMNSIQNVILDELDTFDGILIATTNLMLNFDSAFDRRLLMKIKFDKPNASVRFSIWESKNLQLQPDQLQYLANMYELSPAQILNISKKIMFRQVLGEKLNFNIIKNLCEQELGQIIKPRIGFEIKSNNIIKN